MAQALTEDLLDTLASRFEAAADGYRARIEIDYIVPGAEPDADPFIVQWKTALNKSATELTLDDPVTVGNLLVVRLIGGGGSGNPLPSPPAMFDGSWTQIGLAEANGDLFGAEPFGQVVFYAKIATSTTAAVARATDGSFFWMTAYEVAGGTLDDTTVLVGDHGTGTTADLGDFADATGVAIMGFAIPRGTDQRNLAFTVTPAAGWTETINHNPDGSTVCQSGIDPWLWGGHAVDAASLDASVEITEGLCSGQFVNEWAGVAVLVGVSGGSTDTLATDEIRPRRVSIDKSRRMAASQATVEVPNELGEMDLSPDGHIKSHHPIRIYQWYGDPANEVRTFTGFVDAVGEGRDHRTVTLTCRDTMKRLIVQTFSAIGPQGADEEDTVRTEANGVYLDKEADYIVNDILDQAGWPAADRDIALTDYALDEYIIPDGQSWAEAIIGENALTGLTGYDAWTDELGVFHFAPMLATAAPDSDTDPTPDYTYEVSTLSADNLTSRNVIHLDHEIDDYDLKTRVKVRGNLFTRVAAFTEVWHTNQFNKPVGLWDDPADDGFLKILDRGTKKIYRMRQSDRERVGAGIWPLDISGDVTHPLGLSGDPADSDRFWVLEAAWRTGAGNSASIHKYDASSGAHLAEYSLPDGQWSDLKVSSSFIWVTNYGTDKFHKRSKTDGTNITTYDGPTVNGDVQTNPTGVAIDGTTLLTFWDGKARFLLTDESAPETLDPSTPLLDGNGIIKTAGSRIFGGEMDTDTDRHLFACSDDLGIVWKFALTEPSTDEVFSEVVDTDLEDELGLLSGAEDREHDSHPGDADHPFEVRRATLTLEKTIRNLAQATETALRALDELAHRREVVDVATVGHPGHQRGDLHQLTDPVTGLDALYILDTYRDNMDERGYFATIAYVPYRPVY